MIATVFATLYLSKLLEKDQTKKDLELNKKNAKPKDSYANPEEPVINSYLDDPDPKWSTLRKASSTSRINLKYGSQNKDPYETTHRVELYGKDHTIRRAPSLPTVPIARIDYVTDPKRFSHDADAGWRRMNLRRAP